MTFTLEAAPRTLRGKKLESLRSEGKLPGVVYGPKEASTPIVLDQAVFDKVLKEAGESSIVTLTGLGDAKEVLIQDVAFDPRRGGITHVDLYAIEAGKEITVDVPLEFIGEAPALKLGGVLTKVLHEVEVVCQPKDLPSHIDVDVSVLTELEMQVHVRDLVVPSGVTITNNTDDVVALVQAVKEETEATATIDMSSIEVEKKGKAEESAE